MEIMDSSNRLVVSMAAFVRHCVENGLYDPYRDQHELLALIAPRPLCVGSAADDLWSDPKGERLSLEAAVPVYELYGKGCSERLGYHIREGRHEIKPEDWDQYLRHADKWLK